MAYTLTQLESAIKDNTENYGTRFSGNVDDFIRKAEFQVFRDADLRAWRQHAIIPNATVGKNYLNLPTNLAGTAAGTDIIIRDLYVIDLDGSYEFMQPKNQSWLRDYWPNTYRLGVPKFYAHWATNAVQIAPPPDQPYSIEIEYSVLPTSIVDGGLTGSTATTATLVSGGTGYVAGDVLTVMGGLSVGIQPAITVSAVSNGIITAYTLTTPGLYQTTPSNPVSVVGGNGTGATFTLAYTSAFTYTTWLSENGFDALLSASMIWALLYMKAEAQSVGETAQGVPGAWNQAYGDAVKRLQLQEARERMDDSRTKQPT